jgi:hypothetical protein
VAAVSTVLTPVVVDRDVAGEDDRAAGHDPVGCAAAEARARLVHPAGRGRPVGQERLERHLAAVPDAH